MGQPWANKRRWESEDEDTWPATHRRKNTGLRMGHPRVQNTWKTKKKCGANSLTLTTAVIGRSFVIM